MKQLLKKEMTLTASILSYIFIAFAFMTLLPSYPILVGAFFVCFGAFYSFQKAREANDIIYTALLPVNKRDIVTVKFLFTVVIQAAAFVVMAALVAVRSCLNGAEPYASNTLMNANLAYLGYVLLVYAWFNIFFVGGFFRTAYKIGIPFLIFAIATFLTIAVCESLHFFPRLDVLNADFHYSHIIVLLIGLATYAIGTLLSLKRSQRNFETIDL